MIESDGFCMGPEVVLIAKSTIIEFEENFSEVLRMGGVRRAKGRFVF